MYFSSRIPCDLQSRNAFSSRIDPMLPLLCFCYTARKRDTHHPLAKLEWAHDILYISILYLSPYLSISLYLNLAIQLSSSSSLSSYKPLYPLQVFFQFFGIWRWPWAGSIVSPLRLMSVTLRVRGHSSYYPTMWNESGIEYICEKNRLTVHSQSKHTHT